MGDSKRKKGIWYITPEGEEALKMTPEKLLEKATLAYRKSKAEQPEASIEDKSDIEAPEQSIPFDDIEQTALDRLEKFINLKNPYVELINLHHFIGLWQEFYPKLSDADKSLLPLRPIYFLANEGIRDAVASKKPCVINAIIEGGEKVLAEPFRRDALKKPVRYLPKYKHLNVK